MRPCNVVSPNMKSLNSRTDKSSETEIGETIQRSTSGDAASRQSESGNHEISAIGTLLRQMVETPTREIGILIGKLEVLHKKLQTDGNRIQRDIADYCELTLHVMQLTPIISDCLEKPPGGVDQAETQQCHIPQDPAAFLRIHSANADTNNAAAQVSSNPDAVIAGLKRAASSF